MTYTATLWRCIRNMGEFNAGEGGCQGYRYLEPGEDPGKCGRSVVVHVGDGLAPRERICGSRMIEVGEFELGGEG